MGTVNKIKINGVSHDLRDADAQSKISDLATEVYGSTSERTLINPTFTSGYYIQSNGSKSSFGSAYLSEDIELKKGETIEIIASANSIVCMIARVNNSGATTTYTSLVNATGDTSTTSLNDVSYTANEDMYVVLSYFNSCTSIYKTSLNADGLKSKVAELDNDMYGVEEREETLTPTFSKGNYIGTSGAIGTFAQGYISETIRLNEGETIAFTARGNSIVSMISKVNASGSSTPYTPLVIGSGDAQTTTSQKVSYTATEDVNIALCYFTSYTSIIVSTEEKVGVKDVLEELNEQINGNTEDETTITPSFTNGKYVNTSGAIGSFANARISEEIELKKGQTIKFKARANSIVGMIARPATSGTNPYEVLVTGSGDAQTTSVNDVSYTATTRTIIVLSYFNSYESVTIVGDGGMVGDIDALNDKVGKLSSSSTSNINILSAFDNLVCIGDSLTFSQVYTSTSGNSRQAKRPYPKVLAGICGNEYQLIARGGATPSSDLSEFGSQMVAKDNALAIIYLGTNLGLSDTLDTDVVGDNPDTWANNYLGDYCRIVKKYKDFGAKILLVKIWITSGTGTNNLTNTNNAIVKVGARFGCAVVDVPMSSDNKYHYHPDLSGINTVHYNDLGYAWFASALIAKVACLSDDEMKLLIPNT